MYLFIQSVMLCAGTLQKLIDLLVPYGEDVSFDTENVSFFVG